MGDFEAELGLARVDPDQLRVAVRTLLTAQNSAFAGVTKLREGAAETAKPDGGDQVAALYFQSLLELGYLVASADGLADDERIALAQLVEHATESAVDREALLLHFADLEAGTETLGRRERLVRTAANFDGTNCHTDALVFATLVAIADGKLDDAEADVLRELGAHFAVSAQQVEQIVRDVASAVRRELKEGKR